MFPISYHARIPYTDSYAHHALALSKATLPTLRRRSCHCRRSDQGSTPKYSAFIRRVQFPHKAKKATTSMNEEGVVANVAGMRCMCWEIREEESRAILQHFDSRAPRVLLIYQRTRDKKENTRLLRATPYWEARAAHHAPPKERRWAAGFTMNVEERNKASFSSNKHQGAVRSKNFFTASLFSFFSFLFEPQPAMFSSFSFPF